MTKASVLSCQKKNCDLEESPNSGRGGGTGGCRGAVSESTVFAQKVNNKQLLNGARLK